MEKKIWTTPTLVTLVRGEPQEAILTACKSATVGGGPYGCYGNCATNNIAEACVTCSYGPSS